MYIMMRQVAVSRSQTVLRETSIFKPTIITNNVRSSKNFSLTSSIAEAKLSPRFPTNNINLLSRRCLICPSRNQNNSYKNICNSTSRCFNRTKQINLRSNMTSTNNLSTSKITESTSISDLSKRIIESLHVTLLHPRTISLPRWITPRQFTFTISEIFGHSSFVLVAVSYATDDFLLLRIIAVAGSTAMLFFTYFHPHGKVLWLPFKWNALFIFINTYRIADNIYYKYLSELLSDDLKQLKKDYFDVMSWVDFAKLISLSTEETFEEGDLIIRQGQRNRYVRLVIEGELEVLRDGIKTYELLPGNFVSEAGLHAGLLLSGNVESCCTIVGKKSDLQNSQKKIKVLRWNRTELVKEMQLDKGLSRSLQASLSWDIVRKLKTQRYSIVEHKVADPELWTRKRTEQTEDRYAGILQNMLEHPDFLKKRRVELHSYRTIHHIDDEHHRLALKKCGWTVDEFEAGQKNGAVFDDDDDDDERHTIHGKVLKLFSHLFK